MGLLRAAALFEAVTLLALMMIAVPLKYAAGMPQATSFAGQVHGIAFLLFVWAVLRASSAGLISLPEIARLLLGAFIPFAGFVNERWLAKRTGQPDV